MISRGEGQQLDFKFEISDSRKIARSLVAFANTDGGTLLVGVKDNGAIAGVRSEEEYYMVQAAAQMYSRPEVQFSCRAWTVEKKTVLEVVVPKSDKKPLYAKDADGKWWVYIRVGDQNLLANSVLLKVWKFSDRKKGLLIKYREKQHILLNYLKENESITLSKFTRIAYLPKQDAEDILVNLILLDLIGIYFTEQGAYYKLKKQTND